MTDDELYYKLGYNIVFFRATNGDKKTKHLYSEILKTKEGIIHYAKKNLVPLLSPDKEIIKREFWDLEGLVGATEKQIFHPHFIKMKKYFFKIYHPTSKVCVVMLCSNKKPYSDNKIIGYYYKVAKSLGIDFFILSNPGVIPIDYDNYYPFRWYEWNEYEETESIKKLYTKTMTDRIEEWFNNYTNYTTIISLVRPGETADGLAAANISQKIISIFKKYELNYITIKEEVFKGSAGLLKTRALCLDFTKKMFLEEVLKFGNSLDRYFGGL